jgi:hypothetical protein
MMAYIYKARLKIKEKTLFLIRDELRKCMPQYYIRGLKSVLYMEYGLLKTVRRNFVEYYKITDEKKFAIFMLKFGHLLES